ncbi:MAG: TonB-dependent receptor plug domain-containing protein, partial [Melioribacteraceae bacterium]|nr:TonB-dependent receptor plug domain-containing protein [Melioribacteraceae bacterium]
MKNLLQVTSCIFLYVLFIPFVYTQEADYLISGQDSFSFTINMPAIQIIENQSRLLSDVAGSAVQVSKHSLEKKRPISVNELFNTITGVHALEEDGAGMRMNLGFRGLDPDRSSRVLILEDGIPVALNPYGEPQMYYTPAIDRMESIDILKGSGQILFGPQTVGGVINFITADPPEELDLSAKLQYGTGAFFSSLISAGNSYENGGFRVNYLRKEADNIGSSAFSINDFSAKIKLNTGLNSSLGIKYSLYNESSNSTYLGLTQALYDLEQFDYEVLTPNDLLQVNRQSISATYLQKFSLSTHLHSSFYHYSTTRDWQRQDFSYSPVEDAHFIWGENLLEDGLIYMKNSNGHRNRRFNVTGFESKIKKWFSVRKLRNKLTAGARFLVENAHEQRVNGSFYNARSGSLKNDEFREGKAFSVFALNKTEFTDRFSLSFGVRTEYYNFERDIQRINYSDTSLISNESIFEIIP